MARSFEIFDTLVGRLHKEPHSTLAKVEREYPFPNFLALRLEAEARSDGTLAGIYRELSILSGISGEEAQKLRAFEFQTELSNIFPIVGNLAEVQDGDRLVAELPYSTEELSHIMRHVGLSKKVKICPPQLNVKDSGYSALEKAVFNAQHKALSDLMRAVRLSNPYTPGSTFYLLWQEQSQYNLPILVAASLYLNEFCQKKGKRRLLFTARDCCHLIEVFKALFPEYESIYFYSSRYIYQNPTEHYYRYVKNLHSDDTLIVDGQGTGQSCFDFFETYFTIKPCYIPIVSVGSVEYAMAESYGDNLEVINYAAEGSIVSYDEKGPVLLPLEYNAVYVKPAYACIAKCVELLKHYRWDVVDRTLIDYLWRSLKEADLTIARHTCYQTKHNRQSS